eukprot:GAHX01002031.1.p1 GENE.GAHX01002031.1~~GAHX01002031.1.p1  ORF type:complete len:246 (-),score=37.31 GAHX01002031.1:31-768(-)
METPKNKIKPTKLCIFAVIYDYSDVVPLFIQFLYSHLQQYRFQHSIYLITCGISQEDMYKLFKIPLIFSDFQINIIRANKNANTRDLIINILDLNEKDTTEVMFLEKINFNFEDLVKIIYTYFAEKSDIQPKHAVIGSRFKKGFKMYNTSFVSKIKCYWRSKFMYSLIGMDIKETCFKGIMSKKNFYRLLENCELPLFYGLELIIRLQIENYKITTINLVGYEDDYIDIKNEFYLLKKYMFLKLK